MDNKEITWKQSALQDITLKRVIYFLLGVNALSIGIVLNTKSQLGVGSITTLPYVFSFITSFTLGNYITLFYFCCYTDMLT